MGQFFSARAPASPPAPARARAPAHSLASAPAPAPVPAPAPAPSLDPPKIASLKQSMLDQCYNDEQKSNLLKNATKFMKINSRTEHAELLFNSVNQFCADPRYFAKINLEDQGFYHQILERVSFVALKLNRQDPINPDCHNVMHMSKKERSNLRAFFHTGFNTLVRWCFFELVTIVPERPWKGKDAAFFVRTLEEFNPEFSRLFTKVFDDLIDHTGLGKQFLKDEEYSQYPTHFSDSVFKSLSKVVRPKWKYSRSESETVQKKYGLNYHWYYYKTSEEILNNLRKKLPTASGGTEV